jgi:hypothetical protein
MMSEEQEERIGIYADVDWSTFLLLPLVTLACTGMTMMLVKLVNAVIAAP